MTMRPPDDNDTDTSNRTDKLSELNENKITQHLHGFILTVVTSMTSTLVTFHMQHTLSLSPVMASAVTGVIAHGVLLTPYREVAFCGSFGGMSDNRESDLFTLQWIALLGALIGVLFISVKDCLQGVGGKLGTIAFVCGVICECFMALFEEDVNIKPLKEKPYEYISAGLACVSVMISTSGSAITIALIKWKTKLGSATLASATTGLIAVAVLSLFNDTFHNFNSGDFISNFAYTGSFVGMTASTERLRSGYIVLSGTVGGVVLLCLDPVFPGVGGKLGFSAMIAVPDGYKNVLICSPK